MMKAEEPQVLPRDTQSFTQRISWDSCGMLLIFPFCGSTEIKNILIIRNNYRRTNAKYSGLIFTGRPAASGKHETGRGTIRTRARYEIEEKKSGKFSIVVSEIPYQVNKARLVEKIAELVRDKKVEGIVDLRDESDRKGIRIVIELRKDVNVNVVLNKLFRHTQMEDTFGIIMLSLVKGEPRILNLKERIKYYVEHRQEGINRRTIYELNLANRKHILKV